MRDTEPDHEVDSTIASDSELLHDDTKGIRQPPIRELAWSDDGWGGRMAPVGSPLNDDKTGADDDAAGMWLSACGMQLSEDV